SFFTFQSMSYTIDMYLGNIKVQKNPISFTAFVTLYPQIVAGPIVRYDDVAAELDKREINLDLIYSGIVRFITGLGKKVIIANGIGQLWNEAFAVMGPEMSALTAWLGIIGYTLQIYFDFSGYSDMAIGLGKMMGFNFPENFDYPYLSRSISEFWRRWHMTLGAWFRSYVYIPLGGNRKGMGRTVFNLAVVWILTGIWHGASWNFILWGTLYGVVIIAEKLFLGKVLEKLPNFIRWLYTMLLVVLGWVLFVTPDLPTAFSYMGVMFGSTGVGLDDTALYLLLNYGIMLVIGIFASTDAWKIIVEKVSAKAPTAVNYITPVAKIAVFILCVAYLADATYNPFLYFNF
ncbi:MAG: MBOAT family protein, partial [Ruminiclostridium sp.]|nr:MBOAT family protein [Ruminiclostridium sp.]